MFTYFLQIIFLLRISKEFYDWASLNSLLNIVHYQLSEAQERVEIIFREMDEDESGELSKEEFINGARKDTSGKELIPSRYLKI